MKLILVMVMIYGSNINAMSKSDRVNKVIELMKVEKTTRLSIDAVVHQMVLNTKGANPDKIRTTMKEILNINDMIKFQKSFYSKNFTESELDDVITFQQSKGGIKMQEVAPKLSTGIMTFMRTQLSKNADKLKKLTPTKKK